MKTKEELLRELIILKLKEKMDFAKKGYNVYDFINDVVPLSGDSLPARNVIFEAIQYLIRDRSIVTDYFDGITCVEGCVYHE